MTDADIWADLSHRIAAHAEIIWREPDGADIGARITDTAEALNVERDTVLRVYRERIAAAIGG